MKSLRLGVSPRQGLLALTAAALSALSFPPVGLWPLALPAVCLFLLVLRNQGPETARNLGLLYGLVYGLGTMYWFFALFSALALPLVAIFAAYFGLLATLVSLTRDRSPLPRAALVAMFAVGVEWLRGDAWYLRFPWYTVPHALAQQPAWIAPVRWVGTFGLSFAIWFVAAWGAFGRYLPWVALLLIPASAFLLPELPTADQRALLVQTEEMYGVEQLIRADARGSRRQVDLAVLPEYAYFASPRYALNSKQGPATLARRHRCPVVFGAVVGAFGTTDFENVAVVIDAGGKVLGTFTKQRPVPLFRDGIPGTRRDVFPVGQERVLGVAICYDFDAQEIAACLVRQGATVLVAPTFDALSWGRMQHLHHELLLRLRAVENERWILRAASSGRSEVVNPHGEPSEKGVAIGAKGMVVVAFAHRDSLPWGGQAHVLGPIAAAGSVLFLGVALMRFVHFRRKSRRGGSPASC